eukprot:scaffold12080_cov67-Phaeocystis_antarctica.AAC.10
MSGAAAAGVSVHGAQIRAKSAEVPGRGRSPRSPQQEQMKPIAILSVEAVCWPGGNAKLPKGWYQRTQIAQQARGSTVVRKGKGHLDAAA